ncbi:hypothetical protein [Actinomadura hibisca]|uniref:hypothetical protein n=1 Tax=Actinomadura hibisca TaxID=68565 RepID=UPI00083746BB|nr:hypothetical protein [Actinomadura hibisca]
MSPVVRSFFGALSAAVLLVSSAACSGDGKEPAEAKPPAGAPISKLVGAMSRVVSSDSTRRYAAFSDLERLRRLAGGQPLDRDARLSSLTIGLGDLGVYGARIAEPTGIDVNRADYGMQVGIPPLTAGWLAGPYTAANIKKKLEKLGHKRVPPGDPNKPILGGENTWVAQADGRIDTNDPLAKLGIPPTHPLNAVKVHEGTGITYARRFDTLDSIIFGGATRNTSLGTDPAVRPVLNCLGLPLAALVTKMTGSTDQIGVGVTGDADDLTEVLCVKVSGDANAAAQQLKQSLTGQSATGRPWSELLPGAQVTATSDGVVRLAAKPGAAAKPGLLFQAVLRNDLPRWTA